MQAHSQHDFNDLPLDPGLLATPFAVQTRWQVITGARSCGKTTLLKLLAQRGFRIRPEAARFYIERELEAGRTKAQLRADRPAVIRAVQQMQLSIEQQLDPERIAFLDRAYPDYLTLGRRHGLDPNRLLPNCFHHRYASVILLAPLPPGTNGRPADAAEAADNRRLHDWLARDYTALGYDVIHLPALPPEERLGRLLDALAARGLV